MLKDILKSLSDTEITAIAYEVANPSIPNVSIYNQLVGKSNDDDSIGDDFQNLSVLVGVELANRVLELNRKK
jgi:hypothetical protein